MACQTELANCSKEANRFPPACNIYRLGWHTPVAQLASLTQLPLQQLLRPLRSHVLAKMLVSTNLSRQEPIGPNTYTSLEDNVELRHQEQW